MGFSEDWCSSAWSSFFELRAFVGAEDESFASSAVASASSALSLMIWTLRCTSRRAFSTAVARSLAASSRNVPTCWRSQTTCWICSVRFSRASRRLRTSSRIFRKLSDIFVAAALEAAIAAASMSLDASLRCIPLKITNDLASEAPKIYLKRQDLLTIGVPGMEVGFPKDLLLSRELDGSTESSAKAGDVLNLSLGIMPLSDLSRSSNTSDICLHEWLQRDLFIFF